MAYSNKPFNINVANDNEAIDFVVDEEVSVDQDKMNGSHIYLYEEGFLFTEGWFSFNIKSVLDNIWKS